jgi:hypothetical protein
MTNEYGEEGFLDDDGQMIHDILENNWAEGLMKDKTLLFFNDQTDIASIDYGSGCIAVKIYADEIVNEPRGISFDSVTQHRNIRLNIQTMSRELSLAAVDQIMKILALYRIRPGNDWQTMWFSSYTPIYPTYNFFRYNITIQLKKYYQMLPNVSLAGHQI